MFGQDRLINSAVIHPSPSSVPKVHTERPAVGSSPVGPRCPCSPWRGCWWLAVCLHHVRHSLCGGTGRGGAQPALGFEHLTPCSASEAHHCPRHQKRTSESTQLLALPSPSKGFTSHMSFRPPSPWKGKAGVINEGLVRGHSEFSKSWDWDPLLPMPTTLVKPWVHRLAACLQGLVTSPREFTSERTG